jgi:hypothetical protein
LLRDNNKKLSVSFNHTFWYIDDVLSISNHKSYNYVRLIYPDEVEIEDITASAISASYLDILSNIDSDGRLTTSLYVKRDIFHFAILHFPYLCSTVPFLLLMVCISRFNTQERVCVWGLFKLLTSKMMLQGYNESRLKPSFLKFYGRYNGIVSCYKLSLAHMLNDMFHTNF